MKQMNPRKHPTIFGFIALALLMAACEGPVGPPGPPGFDGLDGRDGRDGNFNVFSINYEILETDWLDIGTPGEPGFFRVVDLSVPEINDDIVDNGMVLAYYRAQDGDPWIALPLTFIFHDPEIVEVFDFVYQRELVTLQSSASDRGGTPYAGIVRIIVAEGIPILKREIDISNYQEVVETLGIEEDEVIHRAVKP